MKQEHIDEVKGRQKHVVEVKNKPRSSPADRNNRMSTAAVTAATVMAGDPAPHMAESVSSVAGRITLPKCVAQ